ncbi:NAD-binding protein [Sulfurospirillum sp. 1612]|uniref:NAD-binding protein n=1 Tax=Sulfurospirillum sp. 1612 TaxID=3094835 RepID=UPI002F934C2E
MNVIIAGAGKVGYLIAKHLMANNDVMVIDKNEDAIRQIQEKLDVLAICGDTEDHHTYESVSSEIDLFIAVTDSDEVNMIAALMLDKIATVKKKIIRLKNSFFNDELIKVRLGISDCVIPSFEAAQPFKYLIDFPHARNVKSFEYTKALLISIKIPEDCQTMIIKSLTQNMNHKLVVAGIERAGVFSVPEDIDILQANDLVYFYAYPSAIKELKFGTFNAENNDEIKNCLIFGADNLGIEIAKVLLKKDLNIQLLDKDLKKCERANLILKDKVTVIKSTYGLDHSIGNDGVMPDLFIVASPNDEYNIAKCMEAKDNNVKKVVAINNDMAYSKLMRNLNLEVVRGEKINAYYSILEKIESSNIVIKRQYCGGEGVLMFRKIFHASNLVGNYLPLPQKLQNKGIFYVQREQQLFPYSTIDVFKKNDVIITFSKSEDAEVLSKWLHSNL